jgi:putative redox protein
MLKATSRAVPGSLRQETLVDGRHTLVTDEPQRVGGDGSAPSPHELLPAALASCIGTTLVMYARTKEWEIGEVSVDVHYDNKATRPHFDVRIRIGSELTPAQLTRLERVAATCPVRRALEAGAVVEERLEAASTRHAA